jgi:hypothetical protein
MNMKIFKSLVEAMRKNAVLVSNIVVGSKEEIVHEMDEARAQQVIFETSANGRNAMLIAATKENTAALSQFLRLNELFVKSMTKYFDLEIKEMEKRAATPALEPSEDDKRF